MARLAHVLAPRERVFFDLFEEAADNARTAAGLLEKLLDEGSDHHGLAQRVTECEREGDRIRHDVLHRLTETFVTPIDAHDIHRLAFALDAVVDRIDEVAAFIEAYRIDTPLAAAQQQAWLLHYACRALASEMPQLRGFRSMTRCTVTVAELASQADAIVRPALAALFDGSLEPEDVVRWKDVLRRLEQAMDAAKRVSWVLEGITIKYA